MDKIITKIDNIIKNTDDRWSFTDLVSDVFTDLDRPTKQKVQQVKDSVVQNVPRIIQFLFGTVTYLRTLFLKLLRRIFFFVG